MAKSKSFFGLRTGSTKTMTFQVNAGKQITKDRVEIVKNPRTLSQMVQRMLLATVTAAYQAMRVIIDHSFEGYSYGQASMSEFVRLNLKAIRNDYLGDNKQYSYNPYRDRSLYPSPFQIAKGSLKFDDTLLQFDNGGDTVSASLRIASGFGTTLTVAQQAEAWGMKLGDYLTLCFISNDSTGGNWVFNYLRLRYHTASDELFDVGTFESCFSVVGSQEVVLTTCDEYDITFHFNTIARGGDECFGTAILSRKSASGWLRSNASIIFPGSPVNTPSAATALATYPVGSDYILNGGSLNGGGNIPVPPTPSLLSNGIYMTTQNNVIVFQVESNQVTPLIKMETGSSASWWASKVEGGVVTLGTYPDARPISGSSLDSINNVLEQYGGVNHYVFNANGVVKADLTQGDCNVLDVS